LCGFVGVFVCVCVGVCVCVFKWGGWAWGLEGSACIREGGNDRNVGNYIMRSFVICAVLSVLVG
jgi:hypothetical protein